MRRPGACAFVLSGLALVAIVAVWPRARPAAAARLASRVILLSVDAGADWIIDRLIARGRAPAFEAIVRGGASAEAMISVLPTLTAVAHASLWTGTYSRFHGVTGNNVPLLPRSAHAFLEHRSGYDSTPLVAEPIWVTAARAGRQVLVLQATGGFPFSRGYPDKLLQFDVYGSALVEGSIIDGRLPSGANARHLLRVGDTELWLERSGGQALALGIGGRRIDLAPGLEGRFTPPIPIAVGSRIGSARLRLLGYQPSSGAFRLLQGRVSAVTSSDPDRLARFQQAAGTIVGEAFDDDYAAGAFGPTLADGGSGDAERLLGALLDANHEYFTAAVAFASDQPWDLLVTYIPNLDLAAHALVGMLDPASAKFSDELAAKVWPHLERMFDAVVDRYVADLRRRFPDANLLIVSDHGMEGAGRIVFPNVALRKAGLLATDASGGIDLRATKVAHLPGHGGGVFLNTADWKGGLVSVSERRSVQQQAIAAMLAIRDPANGVAAIRAVFDTEVDGPGLGVGGPGAPDLYFDLNPGYEDSPRADGDAEVSDTPPAGSGDHGAAPWRRNLQAIFYAIGPEVARGRRVGLVRAIDIAPTVTRLLGIPPPADAIGQPIPLK